MLDRDLADNENHEARLEVNEIRMLGWICGETKKDKIRNEEYD